MLVSISGKAQDFVNRSQTLVLGFPDSPLVHLISSVRAQLTGSAPVVDEPAAGTAVALVVGPVHAHPHEFRSVAPCQHSRVGLVAAGVHTELDVVRAPAGR
jgi:hypothetical protein